MVGWLLLWTMSVPGIDLQAELLDGRRLEGRLVGLDNEALSLQTSAGAETVLRRQLLRLDTNAAPGTLGSSPTRPIEIELMDGSLLRASAYQTTRGRVAIELDGGGRVRLSTRSIRFVRLLPRDPQLESQWNSILAASTAADLVVLRKTTEADGAGGVAAARSVLDRLEAVVGDVSSDEVTFTFGGTTVSVARSKVEGIIYLQQRSRRPVPPICKVSDISGSVWVARSLTKKGDELVVITPSGAVCQMPLASLVTIDYSIGNLTFLRELQAEASEFQPGILSAETPDSVSDWFRPRLANEPVELAGRSYQNPLVLHSRTSLTYRLRGGLKRFRAVAGIDRRFERTGQVRLMISAGERVLLDEQIGGQDVPLEIDLDVGRVRRLTILVDFGENRDDRGDHLLLCDARFTK